MGKAKRKPRPAMPNWFFYDIDDCWFCKNRNGCNGCKMLKQQAKRMAPKKEKGSKPYK